MVTLDRDFIEKNFNFKSNLTVINVVSRRINHIDSNAFKGLKKLNRLMLYRNEIENLNESLFNDLSNLTHLDISFNKLKSIASNTFNCLTNLETLYANNNELVELDDTLFEHLSKLESLHLYGNKLNKIGRNCFKPLKSIQCILLYENDVKMYSFFESSLEKYPFWMREKEKLQKNGYTDEWDDFLEQFDEIGENSIFYTILSMTYLKCFFFIL